MALGSSLQQFRSCHVIIVDGIHLKGKYQETMALKGGCTMESILGGCKFDSVGVECKLDQGN